MTEDRTAPHGGYQHAGRHGWLAHDGHPPHHHNPSTGRIRWATDEEIARGSYLFPSPEEDPAIIGHPEITGTMPGTSLRVDMATRTGRCPDSGTCHGSTLAAGSPVCEPGKCFRVTTSGPLSGVFPGNRWPPEVLAANGRQPDGTLLFQAMMRAHDVRSALQDALGSRDGWDVITGHLDRAAELTRELGDLIAQARANVPPEAARIEPSPDA